MEGLETKKVTVGSKDPSRVSVFVLTVKATWCAPRLGVHNPAQMGDILLFAMKLVVVTLRYMWAIFLKFRTNYLVNHWA